jgi:hypothetical protein
MSQQGSSGAKPSLPSTSSTASTISSPKESTSASLSSTHQIPSQQISVQKAPLRTKDAVKQTLSHPLGDLDELFLDEICLDNELIRLLIGSRLKKLFLQNCTFDSHNSANFNHILEFLQYGNPLKHCYSFAVQSNDCTSLWILYNEFANPELLEQEQTNSLLFVLPGHIPQQSLLDGISSLIFLPPDSGSARQLSSQSKQNLKSAVNQCPNLKYLLLMGIDFGDNIEDAISISQLKSNLIYLWDCGFKTTDPTWFVLCSSMRLVDSMHMESTDCFKFTIRMNGHTTQIVNNMSLSFLSPDFPSLVHGLILSSGQDLLNDILLDNVSLLILLPSETVPSNRQLSYQFKQNLKFLMNHRCPNLKYLFLKDIDLDGNIEEVISSSQLRLDLIYLWNCGLETRDPIWSILFHCIDLIGPMRTGKIRGSKFTMTVNGYITNVLYHTGPFLLMPNSPDLVHGLIISSPYDLPDDSLLDKISFLVLFQSDMDSLGASTPQFKGNIRRIISRRYPNLKHLLLVNMDFDSNIEGFLPISRLNLDLIYLWHCAFQTSDPLWSVLCRSAEKINLMHMKPADCFKFTIRANGHTTQIVYNENLSSLMPYSSDLVHGLIFFSGQDLPNDLLLDDVSFMVFLSSAPDPSNQQPCIQSKQCLDPIKSRQCPKLKYLFLKKEPIDDIEEMLSFVQQFNLEVHILWSLNRSRTNIRI